MSKSKAVAIAMVQENPFALALDSARNAFQLAGDLMYGTPQRTRLTMMLASALMLLGASLQLRGLQVCGL
jgi:hypothetical protein